MMLGALIFLMLGMFLAWLVYIAWFLRRAVDRLNAGKYGLHDRLDRAEGDIAKSSERVALSEQG